MQSLLWASVSNKKVQRHKNVNSLLWSVKQSLRLLAYKTLKIRNGLSTQLLVLRKIFARATSQADKLLSFLPRELPTTK